MNQTPSRDPKGTLSAELRAFIEAALQGHCRRQVVDVHRQPSEYRSSFPLEELEVRFDDGSILPLIFKDTSPRAPSDTVPRVKPEFIYDPLREVEVYRSILQSTQIWAPKLFGSVADALLGRYWLLLEDVPGVELYQVGELQLWQVVVRWLADLHRRLGPLGMARAQSARLLRYDAEFFRRWPQRAARFVEPSLSGERGAQFRRLLAGYDQVVDRLAALPTTLIHGEFYASNVLVETAAEAPRVWAVDWEMAGIGPGLIDLAAVTAGTWTAQQQRTLALTYYSAINPQGGELPLNAFLDGLRCCRLHIAMQWLGWSPEWSPPAAHAHDWLGEALQIAAELER